MPVQYSINFELGKYINNTHSYSPGSVLAVAFPWESVSDSSIWPYGRRAAAAVAVYISMINCGSREFQCSAELYAM